MFKFLKSYHGLFIFLLSACTIVTPSTSLALSSTSVTTSSTPPGSSSSSTTEVSSSTLTSSENESSGNPTTETLSSSATSSLPQSYQIDFISRGGSPVPSQRILENNFILPVMSNRSGFSLEGWFLSNDGGLSFDRAWDFQGDRVNTNLTLYARWSVSPQFLQVASMNSHGLGLLASGLLVGWGQNEQNQVMEGDSLLLPRIIPTAGIEGITKVITGSSHSLLLSTTGEVYAWGSNSHGQLGLPVEVPSVAVPTKITFPLEEGDAILDLHAGHAHSLAVSLQGHVFTWGFNLYGQIGDGTQTTLGTNRNKYTPTLIPFANLQTDEKVVKVFGSAGHSSFALTNQGRLFAWGRSAYGSLGLGLSNHQTRPMLVSFAGLLANEVISSVTIGGLHAFAKTSSNRWFAWGFNHEGQLGNGTNVNLDVPTLLDDAIFPWQTIVTLSAGSNFTLLATQSGQVYAFGVNQSGQLGTGHTMSQSVPTLVNFPLFSNEDTITTLTAAGLQSYLSTSTGRLFAWGSNPYPESGLGMQAFETTPVELTTLWSSSLGLF